MWWQEIGLLLQYAHECATTYFVHGNAPPWHLQCYCVADRSTGASGSLQGCQDHQHALGSWQQCERVFATGGFRVGAPPTERFPLFPGRTGPGNRMRGPGVGSSVREFKSITTDIYGYMDLRSGNHELRFQLSMMEHDRNNAVDRGADHRVS